jgi:hypothetical protein
MRPRGMQRFVLAMGWNLARAAHMPLDVPVQPKVVWNIRVGGTRDAKETQTKNAMRRGAASKGVFHPQISTIRPQSVDTRRPLFCA